jgi:glycolate oxidase iron-sulfur subunit
VQTHFSLARLADPDLKEADSILRTCVHCGFCLATCPTYLILGDELDSPRGRIYLAKTMLENDRPATAQITKHIDRCLTCLSCMTTCPSGVHYAHLVDRARVHIEKTYTRPLAEQLLRRMLATVIPNPRLFRLALFGGRLARPFARWMPGRLKGMVAMAAAWPNAASPVDSPQVFAAAGRKRLRVALHTGCAQQVLQPQINEATVRLLARHGCEVVIARGAGCCGAIVHHLGWEQKSRSAARANVLAWFAELTGEGLDAVVSNASGCGVSLKDYGHLLRHDPVAAEPAARIAAITRDVSEVLSELGLAAPTIDGGRRVTYHAACSMQHGLGLRTPSKQLLADAGFKVSEPDESHICCGSAGTYSILQPDLSRRLRDRKVANLEATEPEIVAAGNIGCMTHISEGTKHPVVHTVELLDWATGGPKPPALRRREGV